jgi:hypothetical protein
VAGDCGAAIVTWEIASRDAAAMAHASGVVKIGVRGRFIDVVLSVW